MAATPETKVKRKVADALKELGVYYFYPVTGATVRAVCLTLLGVMKAGSLALNAKLAKGK